MKTRKTDFRFSLKVFLKHCRAAGCSKQDLYSPVTIDGKDYDSILFLSMDKEMLIATGTARTDMRFVPVDTLTEEKAREVLVLCLKDDLRSLLERREWAVSTFGQQAFCQKAVELQDLIELASISIDM